MKWRCLVVDDEPQAREVIKTYVGNIPLLDLAGECADAWDALAFLQRQPVDLLFLDIEMPRLSGIDLVKTLPAPPKIIFTTAHKNYAWDGFELSAADFLLKPVSFERFLKAVQKVTQTPTHQNFTPETDSDNFLYFRADRKMVKVMVDEILMVESLKDYVKIILHNRHIITKQTISTVEDMLPAGDFLRVHRSFIVNRKKIDSFNAHALFIGQHEVPVGPLYRLDVQRKLAHV